MFILPVPLRVPVPCTSALERKGLLLCPLVSTPPGAQGSNVGRVSGGQEPPRLCLSPSRGSAEADGYARHATFRRLAELEGPLGVFFSGGRAFPHTAVRRTPAARLPGCPSLRPVLRALLACLDQLAAERPFTHLCI